MLLLLVLVVLLRGRPIEVGDGHDAYRYIVRSSLYLITHIWLRSTVMNTSYLSTVDLDCSKMTIIRIKCKNSLVVIFG